MPDASIDVHLHIPAGAQKKDGPSAGIAMVRLFLGTFSITVAQRKGDG